MSARRPFHETIVDQIRDETSDAYDDLDVLGRLIMATKIPKNHDAIIAAWKERIKETDDEDGFLASVLADLDVQKQEAAAEERRRKRTDDRLTLEDALE